MSQPSILFLGATGGCTNAVLANALQAGTHRATALVRTPEKLTDQLKTQQSLPESALQNLSIEKGNALDLANVKNAILSAGSDKSLPDIIVSGLGGTPNLQFNMCHPLQLAGLDNPHICEEAAKTLVTALREIYTESPALAAKKPHIVFVSTTGVSRGPEDVPFGMQFLYHSTLAVPHADKKEMENVFRAQAASDNGVFSSVTAIRPTLLAGTGVLGTGIGLSKIRNGTEEDPAKGFTIQRADVGEWIWKNVVEKDGTRDNGKGWRGEMVSLTS